MSRSRKLASLTPRQLIELWCVTFGEPPPLVHDPALMVRLVEQALTERSAQRRTGAR